MTPQKFIDVLKQYELLRNEKNEIDAGINILNDDYEYTHATYILKKQSNKLKQEMDEIGRYKVYSTQQPESNDGDLEL